ncbi:ATP-binding protein [Lederbergia citrea]|uniref:ATP-binding protein n=1 Tax=Lederbergia citrea TaxID=2833581 RepID=A0A942Z3C5_9BACI|nr:ATP-binding protein [Lederbergia citrea]MBS4221382.1 ATP-binding protein [Lederbergia citrea]
MKSFRNTISVSSNRCENIDVVTKQKCNRQLMIEESREFCFRCEEIAKEDLAIKNQSEELIKNREINELLDTFKSDILINEDLQEATFENYIPETSSQKKALQIARDYVRNFNKKNGLIMAGRTGVGNSHLSVSISKEIIKRKHTCLFISIPRLMTAIKGTYRKDNERNWIS